MRNISNSEVASWLKCQRKYHYEYILDLEPKVLSGPILKGNLIHAMLEAYYLGKMDSYTEEECRQAAQHVVNLEVMKRDCNIAELGKTRDLVMAYFDCFATDDDLRYEVIGVETKFKVPIPEYGFNIVGTIDLVLRDMEDNKYIGVDHKSSYNFWTDDQIQVSGQFPKYMFGLRNRGFDVKSFMVNQIRTREFKSGNELFRRTMIRPSDKRIAAVIQQHFNAGQQIMNYRADPDKNKTIPIYDKFLCANCPFFSLCDSDTEGAPIQHLIATDYQEHEDYGYNKENNNE